MKTPFTCTKLITGLLSLGGLLAMGTTASAVVIDPAADTFISYANQGDNYGTNINLNAEYGGSEQAKNRIPFIRFDLSSYTEGTISGSSLTLRPFDQFGTDQDFDIYGIPDGGTSENFNETGLTWTNSGYLDGSDNFDTTGLDLLGTLTGVNLSDDAVSFSSAGLDTFLNNDTNDIASFVVLNSNGDGAFNKFRSRENTEGGSTLTVIPEPASVALAMALGAFAVVALVRRRRN